MPVTQYEAGMEFLDWSSAKIQRGGFKGLEDGLFHTAEYGSTRHLPLIHFEDTPKDYSISGFFYPVSENTGFLVGAVGNIPATSGIDSIIETEITPFMLLAENGFVTTTDISPAPSRGNIADLYNGVLQQAETLFYITNPKNLLGERIKKVVEMLESGKRKNEVYLRLFEGMNNEAYNINTSQNAEIVPVSNLWERFMALFDKWSSISPSDTQQLKQA